MSKLDPCGAYAELAAASNFSFLRGASHPKDLVLTAILRGHAGLGLADRNTVAGVVRAWSALKELRAEGLAPPDKLRDGGSPGEIAFIENPLNDPALSEEMKRRATDFRLLTGARLVFNDGTPDIIAYPETRAGWGRLTRLLTLGNRRAKKGECEIGLRDLLADPEDLLLILVPPDRLTGLEEVLTRMNEAAPGAVWLGAVLHRRGDDRRRLARLKAMADRAQVPLLALNDVLYAGPEDRDLQDVLTCIREGATIETAGRRLEANAERWLKPADEMACLFKDAPEAAAETTAFLSRATFDLSDLKYEYPEEPVPPGETPQGWLEELVRRRTLLRYPDGAPPKVTTLLAKELAFIADRSLAPYFLTIHDIVRTAEDKGILCQGRGSAANSAVCYVLGITSVDPARHDLLFERFLSSNRDEPPDIDVDFEHERREEVIQYVYERYGRHRAGIAATVIRYRPRSAIREVGKVLGLTEDVTARLASTQWGSWGSEISGRQIEQAGLDAANPMVDRAVRMATRLLGFPRHLSQHVGGFVLTQGRLDETVPIGNAAMPDRTFIEWDKDDIDALGLMKVDVLALGMLTCIRKAFDLMKAHSDVEHDLASVPPEEPEVYDMLCRGQSIGVFQVESRAQINMLPRLRPREFYDLVIQVAIVRPGPIQGDMVHPYLRRRNGVEEVHYPPPGRLYGPPDELKQVLHRTLGVPLFQEQAMKVAMVAARFTDAEANGLRKAMGTFRGDGTLHTYEDRMVGRMIARGYDPDFAQRCFEQIKGFGSYGFPESHAASFARLVYVSSWIKHRHPAAFACALLNSQPMGFYAPAQIVREAQEVGEVEVRPIDVSHSDWDNSLEGPEKAPALRLGLRQIDGFKEDWAKALSAARTEAPFADIETLARRAELPAAAMRKLADADAFRSLGQDRREALWAVRRLPDDDPLPLFAAAEARERGARELGAEPEARLPLMPLGEHVAADYQTARLSLKAHPMAILRPVFAADRVLTCAATEAKRGGSLVRVAGVVLVRQRPGKGNAVFVTLEDETGITNVVLWARMLEQFRREIMGARLMQVEGLVEKSPEGVVHVVARRVIDRSAELSRLSEDHETDIQLTRADIVAHPQPPRQPPHRHPRDVRILPGSRDFH
ncbi:error-prone DNA polymerase [Brevundimonas sp. 3P9-tot-E]|uniref:Error-prone DNA polymerase n=1 Tax=Brevundimonas diminuta TaxID=293 RepID=A0A1Z3LWN2_BREDI|nr:MULTISPECIES: error-prone DNA polymerase [Brevundimonas]ASD26535.1 error-prone DNA polymerase [Brevundimonas diminuta]MBK1970885.1 error-prone DNA polymerase [Brevundimonas diminuta]MBK1974289.1 error-prone DNA polymerase [Brevundimonas diminuta]MDM8353733.1 error-prone DNA polymerase [Brevundimonas diminuta]